MEYSKNIIGRKHEQDILNACVETHRAEFVAIYGRRRIGKTFLVKQFSKIHLISIQQASTKYRRLNN